VAIDPATAALATVAAELTTPALATVPADPATAVLATVAAEPTTAELAAVATDPTTAVPAAVAVRSTRPSSAPRHLTTLFIFLQGVGFLNVIENVDRAVVCGSATVTLSRSTVFYSGY
jgi:hypothetical protein